MQIQSLLEPLATELERSREISAQVVKHLTGTYGVDRDAVGAFLEVELPKLEDYQIDLALSPLFTPTLADQAVFAELVGRESVPTVRWPGLVQQLTSRPTRARLITEDGQTRAVVLREVTIERFVNRLRLDGTISEPVFNLLAHLAPAADQPWLKAIARRAVWENAPRGEVLLRYLTAAFGGELYRLSDVVELLRLMEAYEPANVGDLLARVPHWQEVLRQQINEAASPKPFFNERVQELHGGGRDQRRQDNSRITAKENELAFLERLQQVLSD
jgi:hypothetical protein